jgi:hypothetical protein
VSALEEVVEAAVRRAHAEWTGPSEQSTLGRPWPVNEVKPPLRRAGPTSRVVSWTQIKWFAESAADIGPQVRAELAGTRHLPAEERQRALSRWGALRHRESAA